ncbi:hypothetical protein, partial [Pseudoalteromonas sp. BMB]|uniref:hypothetical protein n=1 Tax=Pseudoalteromonas sp. BMB TaxID=1874619 RepID=UPI000B166D75
PTSVSSAQRSYFEPAAQNPAEQFERTGNLELAYQQGKNEVTLVGNVAEANAGYSFSLNGKLGTAKGGDYTCIQVSQYVSRSQSIVLNRWCLPPQCTRCRGQRPILT